jgi:hypothetical protein
MKNKKKSLVNLIAIGIICLTILWGLNSCKKNKEKEIEVVKISQNGLMESHNEGQDCMTCHREGESGTGWFRVAGTVYEENLSSPSPNGIVRLYTGPDGLGSLRATIEVDGKGNFYTTESIEFWNGLYPLVTGASGSSIGMPAPITNGACNSCHGITTRRIWVN